MRHRVRGMAWLGAMCLVVAACSSSGPAATPIATAPTTPSKASAAPVASSTLGVDRSTERQCDPIGGRCLLPYPNDFYTVADRSTATGRRLAIARAATPANKAGVHIDVTDQDRADGWSPGSVLLAQVPGLDPTASRLPTLAHASQSLGPDAPIVLLDTTTGRRLPYFAEMDSQADPGTPPLLMIHPAVNFPDGHHIVVALTRLLGTDGKPLDAPAAFAAYRDGQRTTDPAFEARRPAMERILTALADDDVDRATLQLAWDFTVASTVSLTGRMISIRDQAFDALGQAAPTYTITKVTQNPDPFTRRRVEGTFETPLFLTDGGKPGGRLVLGPNGLPQRQVGVFTAPFLCNLPAASQTKPARMAMYGHGLLGDLTEVNGNLAKKMSATYDIAYCATNWAGMAEEDTDNAIRSLEDLSNFPSIPDRIQQGYLAFLYLGRLMKSPKGFTANPAFSFGGKPALDTSQLYFDGNSQGAILGGGLTAVAQDFTRSTLAEAGMNYSLLLDRSVDFDEFLAVLKPSYPSRDDRVIGLALAQLLWDRGETDGYANHITSNPLPDTPVHTVLLLGAVGDHQVTEFSLRIEARTLGVEAHVPIVVPDRDHEGDPLWLLKPITHYPYGGSAYFLWDTGSPPAPVTNQPARAGHDPHDDTPSIPAVEQLKDEFWHPNGAVTDVCKGRPCTAPVPPENAD